MPFCFSEDTRRKSISHLLTYDFENGNTPAIIWMLKNIRHLLTFLWLEISFRKTKNRSNEWKRKGIMNMAIILWLTRMYSKISTKRIFFRKRGVSDVKNLQRKCKWKTKQFYHPTEHLQVLPQNLNLLSAQRTGISMHFSLDPLL